MKKKISEFLSENFQFLLVKFSIYLNRRVSEMESHYVKLCLSGISGQQRHVTDPSGLAV